MFKEQTVGEERTLGELVDDCNGEAIRAWLNHYRGARSSEEMLTQRIRNREIMVLRDDVYSKLQVIVTIRARGGTPSETYFYAYRRVRDAAWKRKGEHCM